MPDQPLSLLIDGRALGGAGAHRGLGTYTRELVAGLAAADGVQAAVLAPSSAPLPEGIERVVLDQRGPDRWASTEHQLRLATVLRRRRRQAETFVFHGPGQDPPRRAGGPWVQTVADVIPLVRAEPAYAAERRRWRRWAPRLRAADAIVTFSHHAAAQVAEHLGVDEARIGVIPLAASSRFRPAGCASEGQPRPESIEEGAGAKEPAPPYLLSVGEYAPHKGYSELAQLAAALGAAGLPHRIVIAGQAAPQWERDRERELSSAGTTARRRIEVAGWVPDLVDLYRRASVVVSTSRAEGFGLPLVEAMACGAPVLSFSNTALPEVVADGGTLVPDGDVAAMAEVVTNLVTDEAAAAGARRAALARSAIFSWEATTAAHLEIYRSVLRSRP